MKRLMIFLLLAGSMLPAMAQTGAISGKVQDNKKNEVTGAVIEAMQNGIVRGATQANIDGIYTIKPLSTGKYDLRIRYTGYITKVITGIAVHTGKATTINVVLNIDTNNLKKLQVIHYKPAPATIDDRKVISSEDIEKMPAAPRPYQTKDGSNLNMAGSHGQGNTYIIDGARSRSYAKVSAEAQSIFQSPPVYHDHSNESYKKQAENDFMSVRANPLSTLSVDVDRASYSNVRRFINQGQMPPADAVRVEEMINYFDYKYPQPTGADPISITTELTSCPWQPQHQLLHVGLQAKTISTAHLPASNLVFLIDVSGSMNEPDKLPLLISSLKLLVGKLRAKDRLAIVAYAGNAGLVLPSTAGNEKGSIYAALNRLQAGGSTAGGEGIKLAYNVALNNYIEGGNNRVILATDGDFNVGISADNELEDLITRERKKGISLTCLGFGQGNYKDAKMEMLADKGNGNYDYIDNIMEAEKTLVNEFGGTLFTVAKDVKAQIEFNPAAVQAYRLVGYENRLLNEEDFKDDRKDAGDMGSGHTVTIIYEIIPAGIHSNQVRSTTPLKYQHTNYPSVLDYAQKNNDGELATIKFRYKEPDGNKSRELAHTIGDEVYAIQDAGENARFATSVAMFGMLLKKSQYKGCGSYDNVLRLAKGSTGDDENGYRSEFIELVKAVNNKTGSIGWNDAGQE